MAVRAQVKAARQREAIEDYKKWLVANPDADHDEKMKFFNYYIDRAALSNAISRAEADVDS